MSRPVTEIPGETSSAKTGRTIKAHTRALSRVRIPLVSRNSILSIRRGNSGAPRIEGILSIVKLRHNLRIRKPNTSSKILLNSRKMNPTSTPHSTNTERCLRHHNRASYRPQRSTCNRLRLRATRSLREHGVSKSCLPSNIITGKSSTIEKNVAESRVARVTRTPLFEQTGNSVDTLVENRVDNIDRTHGNRRWSIFHRQLPGENVARIRQHKLLCFHCANNIRSRPKCLRSQLDRSDVTWNVNLSMSRRNKRSAKNKTH